MSLSNSAYDYARVQIHGILTCKSDLHIGDGDLGIFEERKDNKERSEGCTGSYNTVYLDHEERAYIPGSSLRGSLSALLDENNATIQKLFGYERSVTNTGYGERLAGKVRIFDAHMTKTIATDGDKTPYWYEKRGTFISHGISLDDVTGTTEKGKLFRYELVPADTKFAVEIEADKLNKNEIEILLGLLTRWNGASATAIGKGTSKGYGRIEWRHTKTKVLSIDALHQWAHNATIEKPPFSDITSEINAIDISALIKKQQRYEFSIDIYPLSPLLCNEPGFVTGDKEDAGQVFYARNDKAVIPGSTLAGVVRARGRKILMTLLHQADPQKALDDIANKADKMIEELFGNKDRQSAIEFSDATDTACTTTKHLQYFNAIDRFTGGVKEGALFNVEAAQCDHLETETCYLNLGRLPEGDWWKGLLLFIVRDAVEGELAVGWGKSKGYGSLTITLNTKSYKEINTKNYQINNQSRLVDAINNEFNTGTAENWIKALHEVINNCLTNKTKGAA